MTPTLRTSKRLKILNPLKTEGHLHFLSISDLQCIIRDATLHKKNSEIQKNPFDNWQGSWKLAFYHERFKGEIRVVKGLLYFPICAYKPSDNCHESYQELVVEETLKFTLPLERNGRNV